MAEVIWSPQSLQDLESIKSFVAGDSPHYAGLLVQKLVATVYRLTGASAEIVTVFHGALPLSEKDSGPANAV